VWGNFKYEMLLFTFQAECSEAFNVCISVSQMYLGIYIIHTFFMLLIWGRYDDYQLTLFDSYFFWNLGCTRVEKYSTSLAIPLFLHLYWNWLLFQHDMQIFSASLSWFFIYLFKYFVLGSNTCERLVLQ
jgi:hypothetical protein